MTLDVSLREYIETLFEAHAREHELLSEALGKAERAVNQRLEGMNELRDQINTERGEYATRAVLKSEMDSVRLAIDVMERGIGERLEISRRSVEVMQRSQANMEGRAWALAIAIPLLVSALVSLAIKFL